MSELRLVNPQPMETLPKEGKRLQEVFVDYTYRGDERTIELKYVITIEDDMKYLQDTYTYHAWSYTATTSPEGEGHE